LGKKNKKCPMVAKPSGIFYFGQPACKGYLSVAEPVSPATPSGVGQIACPQAYRNKSKNCFLNTKIKQRLRFPSVIRN
jgi:hypothetical protein